MTEFRGAQSATSHGAQSATSHGAQSATSHGAQSATSLRPSQVRSRSIAGLLERLPAARLHGGGDALVTGITHDSRQVRPGDMYLARAGERTHGIDHVEQALEAGAVAVLT